VVGAVELGHAVFLDHSDELVAGIAGRKAL